MIVTDTSVDTVWTLIDRYARAVALHKAAATPEEGAATFTLLCAVRESLRNAIGAPSPEWVPGDQRVSA